MTIKVIITAPHSYCPVDSDPKGPVADRRCDRLARQAAERLAAEFRSRGVETALLLNDSGRLRHEPGGWDMNRQPSRDKQFRRHLKELLSKTDTDTVVFDIHSFPGLGPNGNKDLVYFLAPWNGIKWTKKFADWLNAPWFMGSRQNDIITEATEVYQKKGYLIEFSESRMTESELNKLVKKIVDYCQQ